MQFLMVVAGLAVQQAALWEDAPPEIIADVLRVEAVRHAQGFDIAVLEKVARECRANCKTPQLVAYIDFSAAHVLAQKNIEEHGRSVIEYAKRSLSALNDPARRAALHVYTGDAIRVSSDETSFAVKRRDAAIEYLKGLDELVEFRLPANPPEFQMMLAYHTDDSAEDQRKMEEQYRLRKTVSNTRRLVVHRDVLRGQLKDVYKRRPYNRQELRQLAGKYLRDSDEIDRLVASVPDGNGVDLPRETTGTASKQPFRVFFVLANVVLFGVAYYLFFRRKAPPSSS